MAVEGLPAPRGRRGAELLCAALLLLAVASFFWPVLFGGKSFFFRDTSTIYLPQATLTVEAWKQGRIPLWEPTIAFGYPFQSDPHSMVFYPPALVLALLPMPRAYDLFVVMHVALTGLFTFLLFRRWQLSRTASVTGALLTMFCGYSVSATYLTTLLKGTTWTPLALLAFDCFLVGGRWRALLATALVLAVEGSGTDPQYVLFTIAVLAAAPWLAPRLPRPPLARLAGGLAAAVLIAGALLAYQYLPLLELIRNSERSATVNLRESMAYEVGPGALLNLAVPLAFPEFRHRFFLLSYPGRTVPLYLELYWGIPVLALALVALGWRKNLSQDPDQLLAKIVEPREDSGGVSSSLKPRASSLRAGAARAVRDEADPERARAAALGSAAVAALVLAGVGLALSVGDRAPFYPALSTWLPVLRFFRYPCKHILLTAFALPLAVAIGLDGLLRGQEGCLRQCRSAFRWAAAAVAAGLAGLQFCGTWAATTFLDVPWSPDPIVIEALAEIDVVWTRGLLVLLGLSGLGWALAVACSRGYGRWAVRALACLAVGQMMWFTHSSLPIADDEVLVHRPETARLLRAGAPGPVPPRFMALDEGQILIGVARTDADLLAETKKMVGLRGSLTGCNNVMGSMSVHLSGFLALLEFADRASRADQARLAGALGASHHLYLPQDKDRQGGEPQGLRVENVVMAKAPRVSPRVYIAPRALATSARPGLSPTAAVMALPEEAVYDPADASAPAETPLIPVAVKRCELLEYRAEGLKVGFELEGRGLLVVQDSLYPGWHALVDGQERPIVRVAKVFRGVEVREGERVLEMVYRPRAFWAGAAVSLATLTLVLLSLFRAGTVPALQPAAVGRGTLIGSKLLSPIFFAWRDELTGDASLSSSLKPRASSLSANAARAVRWASQTAWLGLLWLGLIASFWPVLMGHKVLWFRDLFDLTLPVAHALGAAWRAGELGLWQPGLSMGYPLLAEPAAGTLYPPSFLLAWQPRPWLLGLLAVLHLGLAASGTFALLRAWKASRPAAAFGGAVLMFCGLAIGSTSLASTTRTLAWLPWVLLGIERFLASGSSRPLAGAAAALALLALSSDHASLFLAIVLALALPWFRPRETRLPAGRVAARLGLCVCLSCGLAAAALLPALEFGVLGGWNRLTSAESCSPPPGPLDLLNLFVPRPFQDPQSPYFLGGFRDWRLPLHLDLYLGIGVLALALAGLAGRPRTPEASEAAETVERPGRLGALALGCLLLSILPAWAGDAWLAQHQVLGACAARLPLLAMLALAMLSARGLDSLGSGNRRALLLAGLGAALLAGLTSVVLAGFFGHGTELLRAYLLSSVVDLGQGLDSVLVNLRDTAIRHIERVWAFSLALLALAWAGFSGRMPGRTVAVAMGMLTLGDLAFNTSHGLGTVEARSVPSGSLTAGAVARATGGLPRARYLTYPLNDLVLSSEETALVRARMANELATGCRGLLFGLQSTLDFAGPSSPAHLALAGIFREAPGRDARDRLAGKLGAAVALSAEGMGNATGSGPMLVTAGPVVARGIPEVAPRAFIAARAGPVSPGTALPTAKALENLQAQAPFELPAGETGLAPLVPERVGGCRVVSHGWDRVEVEFELEGAGLLVLLDSWSTGWRAHVDGVERPVARVAGLFRGVAVKGGERRLVLTFEPLSFRLGLMFGGVSLLLLLALALRGSRGHEIW